MHAALPLSLPTSSPASWGWLRGCRLAFCLAAVALTLAGCGGGGGGGSSGSSTNAGITGGDGTSPTITIIAAPASQSVDDGRSAVLHVLALSSTPLTLQWLRNGVAVAGATDPDYVTPLLSMADDGVQYAALLRDANGSVRTVTATIRMQAQAPGIAQQPQARTVALGQATTFAVQATGTPPLRYQWQRDGVDIPGASGAEFSTPAATAADDGTQYRALVSNAAGTAVSDAAGLAVSSATSPVILQMSQVAVAAPGQRLVLSTTLAGSPPFNYQWLRNGLPLPGAAGSSDSAVVSLTTDALTSADNGVRYALAVSTASGSTRSPDALVSVIDTPRVAAGGSHSLARSADGARVWAWGDNGHGQLGLGSTVSRNVPTAVGGLPVLAAIAAGADHSLALAADGTVWAWGGNATGAVGDGTRSDSLVPRRVTGLMRPAIAIAAGAGRSFALLADGSLWAWGENAGGALGLGHQSDALAPAAVGQDVAGFGNIVAVAAGARHTLALRADGRVFAFGSFAVPMPDQPALQTVPAIVDGVPAVAGIAAGDGFSVALDLGGRLWSWGLNGSGQLGLGSTTAGPLPSRIAVGQTGEPLLPVLRLAAGDGVVLAQPPAGPPLAWGTGAAGQLGLGDTVGTALAPSPIAGMTLPLHGVSVGRGHVLGMLADGSVVAWGENGAGQLGIGSSEARRADPVQVPKLLLD